MIRLIVKTRRQTLWIFGALLFVAALWALGVELTFERNVRRGIPADFRLHSTHRPVNWKT